MNNTWRLAAAGFLVTALTDESDSCISPHDWHFCPFWYSGRTEQTANDEHDESGTCGRKQEQLSSTDSVNDE
jgi:hypothetical protein